MRFSWLVILSFSFVEISGGKNACGFTCGDGQCISAEQLCDGRQNCADSEDESEAQCAQYKCSEKCEHHCRHLRSGSVCGCKPGFRLVKKRECQPEDICLASGCSQTCSRVAATAAVTVAGQTSARCGCSAGFELAAGSKRCKLTSQTDGSPVILYATEQEISEHDEQYNKTYEIFSDNNRDATLATFDKDINAAKLYAISHSHNGNVTRSHVLASTPYGRPREVLARFNFGVLRDIAVDWITKNVYLIDGMHDSIVACRVDRGEELCADVYTNASVPMSLVLDPAAGQMFWTSASISSPGIIEGTMAGNDHKQRVTEAGITSLALDPFGNRLYWASGITMKIEFMNLQFGTRHQLTDVLNGGFVSSMSVFGDLVYWSEVTPRSRKLRTCDKLTGTNHTTLMAVGNSERHTLNARVLHALLQPPIANPCSNSRCSHLCVLDGPAKASCLCSKYYALDSATQCKMKSDSYLIATKDRVFRVPSAVADENDAAAHAIEVEYQGIEAMDVDVDGGLVYAVYAKGQPKIISFDLNAELGSNALELAYVELVPSLSFDYLNRVLYWLDVHKAALMIFKPSRNVTSKIDLSKRDSPSLVPKDFAVDFFRGRIYVIMGGTDTAKNFIDVYSVDGTLLEQLHPVSPRLSKIAVDLSRGTPYIYDSAKKCLLSVVDSKTTVVVSGIGSVKQLKFWEDRLTWIEHRQRGFRFASSVGWQVKRVVSSSWMTPTRALAFTGARLTTQKSKLCSKQNGGCSHTCLSTQTETKCICPIGMVLGNDRKTCIASAKMQCRADEFSCTNGYQCIPQSKTCDRIAHCDDSSDESEAFCSRCDVGFSKCASSAGCYPDRKRCDSVNDCEDGSDERNCPVKATTHCSDGEFECRVTGDCIEKRRQCNGKKDCTFGDDEESCPCKTNRSCPGLQCLLEEHICDGINDCLNGQDEIDCVRCPPQAHKCDNRCLEKHFVCDGRVQCSDKSDEAKCTNTTRGVMHEVCAKHSKSIWCGGVCVREHEICDHVPNCPNGEDEANCGFLVASECHPMQFKCKNLKCIPHGLICNDEDDCGDQSDEAHELCAATKGKDVEEHACFVDEYKCTDGTCIPLSQVCDAKNHCADGSDEGRHCLRDECHSNHPCQHICHDTPEGFRCSCRTGYSLAGDRVSCVDDDECKTLGVCSHYCLNTMGSFKCFCGSGYRQLHGNGTCEPEIADDVFLFVAHNQIRAISRRRHSLDVLATGRESLINGLTFDSVYRTVYWSEGQRVLKLRVGNAHGTKPVVVATHMWQPSHLSYDWVTENMYFVDGKQQIEVCNLNFTFCAHLPTPPLKRIRSLALAANEGIMFFSYFRGDSTTSNFTGGVFCANMDGSNALEIVKDAALYPSHLQVDFIHRRIFFADLQLNTVETFEFNGGKRRVLLRGHHMHSFALFPNKIFWSEGNVIMRADWFNAASPQIFVQDAYAYLMQVMHNSRQPMEISPCTRAKCSQLCLLKAGGYTCACDALFSLAADNKTCVKQAEHSDYEGLMADLCDPPCENGGSCTLRGDRAFCVCPDRVRGENCEIDARRSHESSALSTVLVICLILASVGLAVAFVIRYLGASLSMPRRFKLSAKYRATDMKKLIENESEDRCHDETAERNISRTGTLNPLYAVNVEQTIMLRPKDTPAQVPEGNLLDL